MSFLRSTVLFLASLIVVVPTRAQPLMEHVPADAVFYVGWRGAEELGPAYQTSHLKGVLDATELGALFTQTLPGLIEREAAEEPDAQEALAAYRELAPLVWRKPVALYVGPLRAVEGRNEPVGSFGLLIKAGPDSATVRPWIERLAEAIREEQADSEHPAAVTVVEEAGLVALLATDEGAAPLALMPANGVLRDAAPAREAFANLAPEPALAVYADVDRLMAFVEEQGNAAESDDFRAFQGVRDALGLRGMKRFAYAGGFRGPDWQDAYFLSAPAPRKGLLALLDGPGLTEDDLKVVPRSATYLSATKLDPSRVMDLIREVVAAAGDDSLADFEGGLGKAHDALGLDLEQDLIRALGSTWVIYNDPAVAGPMGLGVVLVNTPKDAEALRGSLTHLEGIVNERVQRDAEEGRDAPFSMQFKTIQSGDVEIHCLAFPMVSPSWAVHEGRLYVGLFPQAIVTAHRYAEQPNNSIVQNEKFQAVRASLGEQSPVALTYADLPLTAQAVYQTYLMLSQFAAAAMPSADSPAMLLPPLGAILPHLAPAGYMAWTDDRGLHLKSVSPFPGSMLLSQDTMSISSAGMGVGVLLPALGAARRTARQMQSNTQARGIHQACIMYAQGAKGQFPPDLQTLYHGNYFTIDYLVSPTSPVEVPDDFDAWPREQQDAWIQKNASYVLLPGLTENLDTEQVGLFLKPSHAGGGSGVSVAFQDNHVAWMPLAEADALVKEQTGKSMDEWTREMESKTPGASDAP